MNPVFITAEADQIRSEMVRMWEDVTGKELFPAQIESLLIAMAAYRESLVRSGIQRACEQLLVPFATGDALEARAVAVGVRRLSASPALCTILATLRGPESQDRLIPHGFEVPGKGGLAFRLAQDLRIPAGATTGSVRATCTATGEAGNGLLPGEVAIQSPMPGVASMVNTDTTQGGSPIESDEHLRQRVLSAPEAFTTCGSRGAYRFHALGAHPDIADVAVVTPGGLKVQVYPLLRTGTPGPSILQQVQDALSAETVRPLCDVVEVLAPTRVPYQLHVVVKYAPGTDTTALRAALTERATAWAADRRATLGRDLVPERIIAALWGEGVMGLQVVSPVATTISGTEWADCTGITIDLQELANA